MKKIESIVEPVQVTDTTTYYTYKGYQDDFNEDGYPIHIKEKLNTRTGKDTFAKSTGVRKLIRVDDGGKFFNPKGMYVQRGGLIPRWMTVSDKAFNHYINFLKTKNMSYYLNAEREAI